MQLSLFERKVNLELEVWDYPIPLKKVQIDTYLAICKIIDSKPLKVGGGTHKNPSNTKKL